jgi:hypothetical protein
MGLIATGIPGPLNLIAVHKTIHGDIRSALWLTIHFAGWFAVVGLLSIFLSFALVNFDLIPTILGYFKQHQITIMQTGAVIAILAGIFLFFKKGSMHHKHSYKIITASLMTGIIFFPGNWLVFTGSYAMLKTKGIMLTTADALWTLPGIFIFCAFTWFLTIAASLLARKWILKKSKGDEEVLSQMVNKFTSILLFTLAIALLIISWK